MLDGRGGWRWATRKRPSLGRAASSARAPGNEGNGWLDARVEWWRTGLPPMTNEDVMRWRQLIGVLALSMPPLRRWRPGSRPVPGFRSRWPAARLVTQDPMGNLYVHFVAHGNPF